MKTFTRHRTYEEIKEACRKAKFLFSDEEFNKESDYLRIQFRHSGKTLNLLYSTINGRAFGTIWQTGKEIGPVSTSSTEHEAEPWFQALLEFLYVS